MTTYAFTITAMQKAVIGVQADNKEEARRLFKEAWNDWMFRDTAGDLTEDQPSRIEWTDGHNEYNPDGIDADLTQDAHDAINRLRKKEGKR